MTIQKELLLLRHGKSDWNTDSSDFNRPLNKRGRLNAQQMGLWLKKQNIAPDLIISSPATRALSTAEIICKALGISAQTIQTDKLIYQASLADLNRVMLTVPDSVQRLLLVGHNPGLESLVSLLAPNAPYSANGKLMPTAALAYFQLDSHRSSLQGDYWVQRVKDLGSFEK